jgi:pantoate--beta-alanine ligase
LRVIYTISDLRKNLSTCFYSTGKIASIGFVPTMGALHKGHVKLIKKARNENNIVVLSIFVNPTQFLAGEDFDKYPNTFEKDKKIAKASGVDIIFYPQINEIYKTNDEIAILAPKKMGFILEGFHRVGHFNGVLQVVLKLFNIIKPHRAYFGKKDYQQLALIKKMVNDLFLDIQIREVEIVRDFDGLALSSRNIYLSQAERKKALTIPNALQKIADNIHQGEKRIKILKEKVIDEVLENIQLEYLEILTRDFQQISEVEIGNSVILIAGKVGSTRLIDNFEI